MKRPAIANIVQNAAQQVIRGGITMFVSEHRQLLLQFLKDADSDRGAALLQDICQRMPAAAGVVTTLMGGTPQEAINNIALFDSELAQEIRNNMRNFRRLQEAYKRGARQ
jgi:hypothetical protein